MSDQESGFVPGDRRQADRDGLGAVGHGDLDVLLFAGLARVDQA